MLACQPDSALSHDGQSLASYCHNPFDTLPVLSALLDATDRRRKSTPAGQRRQHDIDRLADTVEQHLDLHRLPQPGRAII